MLLVGFLFFALAGLAVLLIWLWHEPQGQQPGQLLQRQAPKIVIRPRQFRTKQIVEESKLPPPVTPPTRTVAPPPSVTRSTTPPSATCATPGPVTPTPQSAQPTTRARPAPVMTSTNGSRIGKTTFKVDFDEVCHRTGVVVRNCRCHGCREMRADAGISQ